MSTFAFPTALRQSARTAFATLGWIGFAVLAVVELRPQAEPAPVVTSPAAAGVAGPASPSFLDAAPEPLPPTF